MENTNQNVEVKEEEVQTTNETTEETVVTEAAETGSQTDQPAAETLPVDGTVGTDETPVEEQAPPVVKLGDVQADQSSSTFAHAIAKQVLDMFIDLNGFAQVQDDQQASDYLRKRIRTSLDVFLPQGIVDGINVVIEGDKPEEKVVSAYVGINQDTPVEVYSNRMQTAVFTKFR
jgi:hypothetical protein